MGVSTDAILCYGIPLDKEYDYPWENDPDGFDSWSLRVCGWRPSVEIYNSDGNYINNILLDLQDPAIDMLEKYYNERDEFEAAHSCPVELVYHGHIDNPMHILAVKGLTTVAHQGLPQRVGFGGLIIASIPQEKQKQFISFLDTHNVPLDVSLVGWYLCSYWG